MYFAIPTWLLAQNNFMVTLINKASKRGPGVGGKTLNHGKEKERGCKRERQRKRENETGPLLMSDVVSR